MKASYSGVNKDVRVLSELTSMVPGREGHVIKQITETWKYTSPNKEFDGALGIAVEFVVAQQPAAAAEQERREQRKNTEMARAHIRSPSCAC